MTDHDAEIVKAAEALADAPIPVDMWPAVGALISLVQAKRAADKPRPLSAEEAVGIFYVPTPATREAHMQAVLDAAAERWLKVIEALPRYDGNGGARLGESVITPLANGRYVELDAIRSALTGGAR